MFGGSGCLLVGEGSGAGAAICGIWRMGRGRLDRAGVLMGWAFRARVLFGHGEHLVFLHVHVGHGIWVSEGRGLLFGVYATC